MPIPSPCYDRCSRRFRHKITHEIRFTGQDYLRAARVNVSGENCRAHVCGSRTADRSLSSCTAAGDTYKLANQVLIPARFTPISPHPAANTLIRPLILRDKSFRSSYGPFVVRHRPRIGSRPFSRLSNDKDRFDRLLSA